MSRVGDGGRSGTSQDRTPAVGGLRDVPAPDPVARDYLRLALRLDRHAAGTVDGYYGPADLRAQVDGEPSRAPTSLSDDAIALRGRLAGEVADPDRRHWLDLQLIALEALARTCSGESMAYLEQVRRCFTVTPERSPEWVFEDAAGRLDALLPGAGPIEARLHAEDRAWTVPVDRVMTVLDVLVPRFRARSAALFGLPDGEDLRVSLVHDQPWTGYNWYDGGYRSRVDINVDLPIRLPGLIVTASHETYPGHHLEHATKERRLVEEQRRLEASILLINTPECLISEGLANVGCDFVAPLDEREDLLVELAEVAALPLAADAGALRAAARRQASIAEQRATLERARINAALMLHEDGLPRDEVAAFLVEVGRTSPETTAKRLEFIEHPLWRIYVFTYTEGEAMLRRWLHEVPPSERPARFGRLLREELTPPRIQAEITEAG